MRRRIGYGALGIILVAVGVGLWAWRWDGAAAVHPDLSQPPAATAAPAEVPAAAMAAASATVAPPPAAARPAASFDVVRVSPQGNAVIAGRAVPNAEVVALDGNTVIGRATADKRGEWVILPEAVLSPGSHTLRLDAPTLSDERVGGASEEISITVPAPSGAMVAAMPAVARPPTAPTSPRTIPEDLPTSIEAADAKLAQGTPAQDALAQGTLAQGTLAQDKAAQDKAARDKNLVVQPGNSLWRIARNSYGAGRRYAIIYSANRDRIGDPDLIYPGQIFMLPEAN
jgi:nucleoid-associated protein YgaU